jgi:hypothetical protein
VPGLAEATARRPDQATHRPGIRAGTTAHLVRRGRDRLAASGHAERASAADGANIKVANLCDWGG